MIHRERLLNTFLDYVRIDSESRREGAMAARVKQELEELGLEVFQDDTRDRTGSETGNLYTLLPGNRPGEPILLCAHLDTVPPGRGIDPVVENGMITSRGETVLGGDDKGGVAAIMEALRVILEEELPHPDVEVVFTVCEEIGLLGAKALDYDRIRSRRAVILDSVGRPGKIVNRGPGHCHIRAKVMGRSAHAGMAPEEGISAIQVLCEGVANMELLRVDEDTTANVGSIHADYPPNIVPAQAELFAECRSLYTEKLEAQAARMLACLERACEKHGARLEGHIEPCFTAFHIPRGDPFLEQVVGACERLGLEWRLAKTGGGSDAHVMNLHGIRALILGTGMSKVHTVREELAVGDLEDTARWALELATMGG